MRTAPGPRSLMSAAGLAPLLAACGGAAGEAAPERPPMTVQVLVLLDNLVGMGTSSMPRADTPGMAAILQALQGGPAPACRPMSEGS